MLWEIIGLMACSLIIDPDTSKDIQIITGESLRSKAFMVLQLYKVII